MTIFLGLIAVLVLVGLYMNWNLGRGQERKRRERELQQVIDAHHDIASRVVELFGAVEKVRGGDGKTQAAFAAVERSFARASEAYLPLDEEVQDIQRAFDRGDFRPLQDRGAKAKAELKAISALLVELEAQLNTYRGRRSAAFPALGAARERLQELEHAIGAATKAAGFPLPVTNRVQTLADFLAKAEAEVADNPVGAAQMAADLSLRLGAVADEIGSYTSAVAAITQAEAELAAVRSGPLGGDPRCADALQRAESAAAALRPDLQAGGLDRFGQRLLELQTALREARRTVKEAGPLH